MTITKKKFDRAVNRIFSKQALDNLLEEDEQEYKDMLSNLDWYTHIDIGKLGVCLKDLLALEGTIQFRTLLQLISKCVREL